MRKERQGINWPTAFAVVGMLVCAVAVIVVLLLPVEVEARCEIRDWKEVPNSSQSWDFVMFKDMDMYPDYMDCNFKGKAPMMKIGWMFE